MKKLFVLLLVGVLILSGCSSSSDESNTDGGTTSNTIDVKDQTFEWKSIDVDNIGDEETMYVFFEELRDAYQDRNYKYASAMLFGYYLNDENEETQFGTEYYCKQIDEVFAFSTFDRDRVISTDKESAKITRADGKAVIITIDHNPYNDHTYGKFHIVSGITNYTTIHVPVDAELYINGILVEGHIAKTDSADYDEYEYKMPLNSEVELKTVDKERKESTVTWKYEKTYEDGDGINRYTEADQRVIEVGL